MSSSKKGPPPLPRVRSNNSSSFSVNTATNSRVTSAESISSKASLNDSSSETNNDLASKKPLGRRVSKDVFSDSGYVPSSLITSAKPSSRPASPPSIAPSKKGASLDFGVRPSMTAEIVRPPSLSSFSPPATPPTETTRPDSAFLKSANHQPPFSSSSMAAASTCARFPSRRQSNGTMTPPEPAVPTARSSPSPVETTTSSPAPMRPMAPPSRDGPARTRSGRPNRVAPRSPSSGETLTVAQILTLPSSDTGYQAKSLDDLFPDDLNDNAQSHSYFGQTGRPPSSVAAEPLSERMPVFSHSPREARLRNTAAVSSAVNTQGHSHSADLSACEPLSSPRSLLPRSPREEEEDTNLAAQLNAQRSLVDQILQQSRQQQSQEEELSRYLDSLRSRVVEDGLDILDNAEEVEQTAQELTDPETLLEAVSVLKQEETKTDTRIISHRAAESTVLSPSAEKQAMEEVIRLDKLIQEEFVRSASVMSRITSTPSPSLATALVPIDKKSSSPSQPIEEHEPVEAEITIGEGFTPEQEDLTKLLDIDRRLRELENSVASSSPAKSNSILPLSRIESFASRTSQKEKLSSLPLLWSTSRKSDKDDSQSSDNTGPSPSVALTKLNESAVSTASSSRTVVTASPQLEASASIDGYSRYQQLRDSWRKAESEHDQKMKVRRRKMDKDRDSALETSAASLRSRMNQFQGDIQGLEEALDETILEGDEESSTGPQSVEEKKGTGASLSPKPANPPQPTVPENSKVSESEGDDLEQGDEEEEEEDPAYRVHPRYAVRDDVSELYDEEDQSVDADAVSDDEETDENSVGK